MCLVVFVCLFGHALASRVGVWLLFFDASFWCLFVGFRFSLIVDSSCLWMRGFCLESLILAQDERWRRA